MNNLQIIKNFIKEDRENKLLINQVNDEIAYFYVNFIEMQTSLEQINLTYQDNFIEDTNNDLFGGKFINLCFSNNNKDIIKNLGSKNKCIIFTDYKNYKKYLSSITTINGYEYKKDIKYLIEEILQISNLEILEFCTSTPYLTFSETSKYLVNASGYLKESNVRENTNFILDIRKKLFILKRNHESIKKIYFYLKEELKYKKFNFLIY